MKRVQLIYWKAPALTFGCMHTQPYCPSPDGPPIDLCQCNNKLLLITCHLYWILREEGQRTKSVAS